MPDVLTPIDVVRDEIVADLEAILEDARAGQLSAYVFVAVKSDSNLARGMVIPGGHANGLLYLALDVAKQQIMDRVAEAFMPPLPPSEPSVLAPTAPEGYEVEETILASEEEMTLSEMIQPGRDFEAGIGGQGVQEVLATDPEGGDVPDMAPDLRLAGASEVEIADDQPIAPRKRRNRKGA